MLRRTVLSIGCLLVFFLNVKGQTFTWTGAADSLWSNASNWSGATGYPDGTSDDIVFNNNTVSQNILLTEDIDVGTISWGVRQSKGFDLNGFDLTVNGVASFSNKTKFSPDKSDGQLIFEDDVDFSTGGTYRFYNVTQNSGTLTLGSQSQLTFKAPTTKVDIAMNHIDLNDDSKLVLVNPKNFSFVDFTVGAFCIVEFARNKTTTISGTVSWDQADCSTYNTFRSFLPGIRAKLKFTGGAATGDFNIFEDIKITTGGGGNTFTANNHTDLGNNNNISGTPLGAKSCEFDGNGDNTGDWSNNSEWDCGCVPRPIDDVTIQAAKTVDLDIEHVLCDDLIFASSTSRISGGTGDRLEIHGVLITAGVDNFSEHLGTTEFRNDVTATTETLECAGCDTIKFYGRVHMEFPGNTWQLLDHLTIVDENDKKRGDLTVDDGTLDANDMDVHVENDFKINGDGTIDMGTGALHMINQENSTLTMSGTGFLYDLVINKSSIADSVEIQTNIIVTNQLDLSNVGIITMNSAADTLILNDNATVTGANNSSHVNPYMKKVGNDNFMFPIGNGTYYRPIGVTDMAGNSTVTDAFYAIYYLDNPFNNGMTWTSWESSIKNVNTREYWDLDDLKGSPTPKLILSWDAPAPSGTISDISKMTVSHWNGSVFEDLGNGSTSGNIMNGTVTSILNATSFSPFASGSTGPGNTLPVSLVFFEGKKVEDGVLLDWTTMTEINVDYYEIERKDELDHFIPVGMMDAAGNSKKQIDYSFLDETPQEGTNYYRLKMVDLDGTFEYSSIERVDLAANDFNNDPMVYPNPARAGSQIQLLQNVDGLILLKDLNGRPLASWSHTGINTLKLPNSIKPGVYLLETQGPSQTTTHRLVVQ